MTRVLSVPRDPAHPCVVKGVWLRMGAVAVVVCRGRGRLPWSCAVVVCRVTCPRVPVRPRVCCPALLPRAP